MKKENIKTIIIVVLALVIVIGGSFVASVLGVNSVNDYSNQAYSDTSEIEEEVIPEAEQSELTMIDIDQYLALKKGSEVSIIYVARPTCGFCQKEEPIVKNLTYLYQLQFNYLNTDALDEEGFEKLENSDDVFSSRWGTPMILLVQNDQVIDSARGYHTKSELIEFFTTHGLI